MSRTLAHSYVTSALSKARMVEMNFRGVMTETRKRTIAQGLDKAIRDLIDARATVTEMATEPEPVPGNIEAHARHRRIAAELKAIG